jgi:hypothetical protein
MIIIKINRSEEADLENYGKHGGEGVGRDMRKS